MSNVEISMGSEITSGINSSERVLPSAISAYERCGYEAGYARGVSDVLAAMIEAAAAFSRFQAGSAKDTFRLVNAFSEYLEQKIQHKSHTPDPASGDGSGI